MTEVKDEERYVLYTENGHIKGTPSSNRNAPIQNAFGIIDFTDSGFKSMDQAKVYCEKYMKVPVIVETAATDSGSDEEHTCVICGKKFKGYGNNPRPVKNEGVCCDECNWKYVIPKRAGLTAKDSVKPFPYVNRLRSGSKILDSRSDVSGRNVILADIGDEKPGFCVGYGYDPKTGEFETAHYYSAKDHADKEFSSVRTIFDSQPFAHKTKDGSQIIDAKYVTACDRKIAVVLTDSGKDGDERYSVRYNYDPTAGKWKYSQKFSDADHARTKFMSLRYADSVIDRNKEIWDGWTVGDFIDSVSDALEYRMSSDPFKTPDEMKEWIHGEQPYYKQPIPEVDEYFVRKYFHG
jgi:DNA-directed RNA polymerase subunit RPC12/RpoP